jgi:hypothetical protein
LASTTAPAWLNFDIATGILSGTPAAGDVGNQAVTLTVTDGTDTVTQEFVIVVTAAQFTALQVGQRLVGPKTKSGPVFTLDASNSTIRIMVWKTVVSLVGIKLAVGVAAQIEILVSNTEINQWEGLVFNFSGNIGLGGTVDIDIVIVCLYFDAYKCTVR